MSSLNPDVHRELFNNLKRSYPFSEERVVTQLTPPWCWKIVKEILATEYPIYLLPELESNEEVNLEPVCVYNPENQAEHEESNGSNLNAPSNNAASDGNAGISENTPISTSAQSTSNENDRNMQSTTTENNKKGNCPQEYKPALRSGGYAILIALIQDIFKNSESPGLKKEILIEKAQQYSEESFTRPKPQPCYTAWSDMSKLISKGLVMKTKNKHVMYSLSDQGIILATNLLRELKNAPTTNDIIFNNDIETPLNNSQTERSTDNIESDLSLTQSTTQSSNAELITMHSGSFEIILLIDNNEIGGATTMNDQLVEEFKKYKDLKHEYRSLKVGDFMWIARSYADEGKTEELVLPYVIERKRMDNLGASVKDGQFHEQKFPLRKSGFNNVIYLVEHCGSNSHVRLPMTPLMQALANARVQDGFKIHVTETLTNSCRFLAMMTKRLTGEFQKQDLKGDDEEPKPGILMSFWYFNKFTNKTKPLTVTETFIKLLMELKGMSVEMALCITAVYKTPAALIRAYKNCPPEQDPKQLLANLKYANKCVGLSVSKSIYYLFTKK